MGDGGDTHRRTRRALARDIAGEFGEGAFQLVSRGIELQHAFDDDLGGRRHMQIDGLAFDELDGRASNGAHHVIFAGSRRHRHAAAEIEARLPADHEGDRHLRGALLLPGGDVMTDILRAVHQDGNLVLARHHAAIDADIHHAGVGVFTDAPCIGDEIASAIGAVPMRRRQLIKIDVLAFDDVFFHRAAGNDLGRHGAGENAAADLHQLARMGVGGQTQHHRDAPIARQRTGEDAPAA